MHFPGKTVTHRVSAADALTCNRQIEGTHASDDVAWHDLRWFQYSNEKLLSSDFTADEDLGWRLHPDDRTRLAANGHPHGILRALVDYWRNQDSEPSYSAVALAVLHQAALETSDDSYLQGLARLFAGKTGADFLRRTCDAYPPTKREDLAATETAAKSDRTGPIASTAATKTNETDQSDASHRATSSTQDPELDDSEPEQNRDSN